MTGKLASMTGFGEAQGFVSPRLAVRVRLWSVNSKGLEISLRFVPRGDFPELELALRHRLGERVQRGRVFLVVELKRTDFHGLIRLNWNVAEALVHQLADKPEGVTLAPLQLGELMNVPGFLEQLEGELAPEERQGVMGLVEGALAELEARRAEEARLLLPALLAELERLEAFVASLAREGEQVRAAILRRLRERLATLIQGGVEEGRVVQEAALLAERCDVAEEQARLAAHLEHFRRLLQEGGAVGRKLDFLAQEMLREINTAAAKVREVGFGMWVVEAKAAAERLREQCANLL